MKILFLCMALMPLVSWASGGTVENGGDTIVCRDLKNENVEMDEPFPGEIPADAKYYSLDYVYAIVGGLTIDQFIEPKSIQESYDRLDKIFSSISPKLQKSFKRFSENTKQIKFDRITDYNNVWIQDRAFVFGGGKAEFPNFPDQCAFRRQFNGAIISFKIYQRSIRRLKKIGFAQPKYKYDPESLGAIAANSVLQFSFMMVHEWLWDFSKNINVNRRVNAFLHSREIDSMNSSEIRNRLKKYGMRF